MKKKRSLGFGFPDEVAKVSFTKALFKKAAFPDWVDSLLPNFDPSGQAVSPSFWRSTLLIVFCLVIFFIIFVRLFHLQIIQGSQNRELADSNRIQIKLIHAPRGVIFDRNGKILAANSPAFRLFDKDIQKTKLITREQALELEVKNDPRAKDLEVDNVRTYPFDEKLAHVVGYVGEISKDQLKMEEFKSYKLGDRVGKSGIEAQYEKLLRGIDGGEIIEVDSQGHKLRTLRKNPPIAGQNIYLTINSDLQNKIYELTKNTLKKVDSCCGAIVAMDPQSGQILALVSFPSFDPNLFTNSVDEGAIAQIFSNPSSPILNRAIAGTYAPGSTFKIVSSLAGLASLKITPDTTIEDTGKIFLGPYEFTNWYFNQYGKVEGAVNLNRAIKRSNDTYFYFVGQKLGEKVLGDWAKKLQLGNKLGIDLPGEEKGLIPDDNWKQKTLKEVWFPGDTLHMVIGQGFVLTTPLQILGITSYVAADGKLYKPQLLLKAVKDNTILEEFKPKVLVSNLTDIKWVRAIKEGLIEAAKPGGTAWPFFTFPIQTAGKTGTAEFGDPKNRTHAWYTSFAPATDPKIALTVLVEAGGEGSNVAAPIAKEVYRWFLSEDKNKLIPDVYAASESAKILGE